MSLYDSFTALPPAQWKYYWNAPDINFNNFHHAAAYDFIRGTYEKGEKDKIFDVGFKQSFKKKGKHQHTVALYFLGCLFQDIVDEKLNNYLSTYIPTINGWYDFRYTWFLTCLYHDTAAIIEKSDWRFGCASDLDCYLNQYDVIHNVFEHPWVNNNSPHTYSEDLIKSYFKYRIEHCHSIDHGIIAGYLLYDRLVKNYNAAWAEYSNVNPNGNRESFYHKGLHWRKEHLPHFAIVADAIIAHNVWLNRDRDLYQQYGLDSLIIPENNLPYRKLRLENNPLVFFLDLFDTVEPVKFFTDVQPKVVLEEIESDNNLSLVIKIKTLKADGWYCKIKSMEDWLDVAVSDLRENQHSKEFTISINSEE